MPLIIKRGRESIHAFVGRQFVTRGGSVEFASGNGEWEARCTTVYLFTLEIISVAKQVPYDIEVLKNAALFPHIISFSKLGIGSY